MQITDKHRIAYKAPDAPGEPVEMAIWQDEDGDYYTATGDIVASSGGEPVHWVLDMLGGTSPGFVGHLIEPPFEPHVGMVIENPDDPAEDYAVCYWVNELIGDSKWTNHQEATWYEPFVKELIEDGGWRVRNER